MSLKIKLLLLYVVAITSVSAIFRLSVVHSNDIQSHYPEFAGSGGKCSSVKSRNHECFGGISRHVTKIRQIRKREKNVLVLNSGDFFQGTSWHTIYRWRLASVMVPLLDLDAMSLGNHEFDDGVSGLLPFLEELSFPVLCCNMNASSVPILNMLVKPSTVVNVSGENIGIIGYIAPEIANWSHPGKNLVFTDEIACLKSEVKKLTEKGVNKIIALGHSGYQRDKEIARKVSGLDIIVGGHSGIFLFNGESPGPEHPRGPYPTVVTQEGGSKSLVVQVPEYGKYLGHLKVFFDDKGHATHWSGNPILLDNHVARDPLVLEELAPFRNEMLAKSPRNVGHSSVFLCGCRRACRMRECNMGNFVTDAIVHHFVSNTSGKGWTSVAVAVWNSGAIRGSLEIGNITLMDLMDVLPFQDSVEVVSMSGAKLKQMLEHSVAGYDASGITPPGSFLQVSGIQVHYDLTKPPGHRVTSLKVRCSHCRVPHYSSLHSSHNYKVAMPSFTRQGGDGYEAIPYSLPNPSIIDMDMVVEYLNVHPTATTGMENRITLKTASDTKRPVNRFKSSEMTFNLKNPFTFAGDDIAPHSFITKETDKMSLSAEAVDDAGKDFKPSSRSFPSFLSFMPFTSMWFSSYDNDLASGPSFGDHLRNSDNEGNINHQVTKDITTTEERESLNSALSLSSAPPDRSHKPLKRKRGHLMDNDMQFPFLRMILERDSFAVSSSAANGSPLLQKTGLDVLMSSVDDNVNSTCSLNCSDLPKNVERSHKNKSMHNANSDSNSKNLKSISLPCTGNCTEVSKGPTSIKYPKSRGNGFFAEKNKIKTNKTVSPKSIRNCSILDSHAIGRENCTTVNGLVSSPMTDVSKTALKNSSSASSTLKIVSTPNETPTSGIVRITLHKLLYGLDDDGIASAEDRPLSEHLSDPDTVNGHELAIRVMGPTVNTKNLSFSLKPEGSGEDPVHKLTDTKYENNELNESSSIKKVKVSHNDSDADEGISPKRNGFDYYTNAANLVFNHTLLPNSLKRKNITLSTNNLDFPRPDANLVVNNKFKEMEKEAADVNTNNQLAFTTDRRKKNREAKESAIETITYVNRKSVADPDQGENVLTNDSKNSAVNTTLAITRRSSPKQKNDENQTVKYDSVFTPESSNGLIENDLENIIVTSADKEKAVKLDGHNKMANETILSNIFLPDSSSNFSQSGKQEMRLEDCELEINHYLCNATKVGSNVSEENKTTTSSIVMKNENGSTSTENVRALAGNSHSGAVRMILNYSFPKLPNNESLVRTSRNVSISFPNRTNVPWIFINSKHEMAPDDTTGTVLKAKLFETVDNITLTTSFGTTKRLKSPLNAITSPLGMENVSLPHYSTTTVIENGANISAGSIAESSRYSSSDSSVFFKQPRGVTVDASAGKTTSNDVLNNGSSAVVKRNSLSSLVANIHPDGSNESISTKFLNSSAVILNSNSIGSLLNFTVIGTSDNSRNLVNFTRDKDKILSLSGKSTLAPDANSTGQMNLMSEALRATGKHQKSKRARNPFKDLFGFLWHTLF